MKVYLARHGDATAKEVDSECPLSEKGKKDLELMTAFLSKQPLEVDYFFHSGKLRAQETAEILVQALQCKRGVEARSGLDPLDLVGPIASEINQFENNLALVGHMPFMGKLLSKLLTGYETNDVLAFQTSTLVCLERMGSDWIMKWALCPELFNSFKE
jgi:phosphohistidine phosphatase